eukprot:11318795-Alexandrium_andersonii.AAC.1
MAARRPHAQRFREPTGNDTHPLWPRPQPPQPATDPQPGEAGTSLASDQPPPDEKPTARQTHASNSSTGTPRPRN